MALEGTRQRELAQLVSNHILGYIDGDVLLAVVHGNSQADKVGQNGGTPRPGLDRALVVRSASCIYLLDEVLVYERTFFY